MARKKRMKKRARGRDGREGGERRKMERWESGGAKRERCGERGRGKGVAKGEEGEKKGWAVEGEESQGGEGRVWNEKTWEGVKKIENAMPRRHVHQGTLSGDTGKYMAER